MLGETHFMGRSGFYWWMGVVEDRQDPDKLGRLRVRILGSDTKDKSYIKSTDLQWAYPIQQLTSAARNGLGYSPLGPLPGTWVFGFYRDGEDMQEPVVLGTVAGLPQNGPIPTDGFNDPRDIETTEKLASAPRKILTRYYPFDGTGAQLADELKAVPYPRITHPLGAVVLESDVNRIARNENINDTIIALMQGILDENVPIAFGGTWDEPDVWYNGVYPYIHTYESESGHVKVTDDTPNAEGTLDWDRTGTFKQTQTDGSEIHKIVMDGYTIVLRDNYVHVMADQDVRVDHEDNLSVGGRLNVEVTGNINVYSHQSIYAQCAGELDVTVGGNAKIGVGGSADIKVNGDVRLGSGGSVNIKGGANVNIQAARNIGLLAGGNVDIKAGGYIALDAPLVEINSGVANPLPASSPGSPTPPKQ